MQPIEMQPNFKALEEADPHGIYVEALACYDYMMSAESVAEFLGQTPQAVTQYLRNGSLRGIKSGKHWRIPKLLLIQYLNQNTNSTQ